jgi:hypothetical protein
VLDVLEGEGDIEHKKLQLEGLAASSRIDVRQFLYRFSDWLPLHLRHEK